jgi:protein TonB
MLSTLIESRRIRSRNRGAEGVSVIVHAVVISLLAAVTAHASDDTPAVQPPNPETVYFEPLHQKPPITPSSPVGPRTPSEPILPTIAYEHVDIPLTIPTDIPPLDVSLPPVDHTALTAGRVEHRGGGESGSLPSGDGSGSYSAWQVEKAVVPLPGNPKPEYPSMLQSAHVDGEVLAQFVVDSAGRVDMSTFRALRATNELFVSSVRRALAEWKFKPAEVEGRKVRQLVQMPLTFRVR